MIIIDAGERIPFGIVEDISLLTSYPISTLDKIRGIIAVQNEADSKRAIEYLKVHGFPNTKVLKVEEQNTKAPFVWGSVEHQKHVAEAVGYDVSKWNPDDDKQAQEFSFLIKKSLLSGTDTTGKKLSPDDLSLMATIVNWK